MYLINITHHIDPMNTLSDGDIALPILNLRIGQA